MLHPNSSHSLTPEFMASFSVTKDNVPKVMARWLGQLSMAPGNLRTAAHFESCSARYVPFWLFDASAQATYAGRRGDQIGQMAPYIPDAQGRRTDGKGQLIDAWGRPVDQFNRQIDKFGRPIPNPDYGPPVQWQPVSGEVRHYFKKFPICATEPLPSPQVEQLTWHFDDLTPYRREVTEEVLVAEVKVNAREAAVRAQNAMDQHLRGLCQQRIGGARQEVTSFHSSYTDLTSQLAVLPIWLARYSYRGKTFTVAINGASGEVVGERPYSKAKMGVLIGGAAAVVIAVFLLILAAFAVFAMPVVSFEKEEYPAKPPAQNLDVPQEQEPPNAVVPQQQNP
jgi:hypothetical protein